MGLNIKNTETERLIRQLAAMAGEGQTEAVTVAVRERLERLDAEKARKSRFARMRAIVDEMAPLFKPPYDKIDHADLLYDPDTGLPK
jgi:antitoxin VapB